MIYTVIWLPAAEHELAELWLDPATREGVTQAANYVDRLLRSDPAQLGESRDVDQRILFVVPLGVLFRVRPPDRLVEVVHVWKFA